MAWLWRVAFRRRDERPRSRPLHADSWSARVPSPNYGARRGWHAPDMVLLHYTGMDDAQAAALAGQPGSRVSAHYLIDEDGAVIQMVSERQARLARRASSWAGERDINSVSIGIEIHNPGMTRRTVCHLIRALQMEAVAALCRDIAARWSCRARVLGHSDVPRRASAILGEHFDWQWLSRRASGFGCRRSRLDDGIGSALKMKRFSRSRPSSRASATASRRERRLIAHPRGCSRGVSAAFRPARVHGRALIHRR